MKRILSTLFPKKIRCSESNKVQIIEAILLTYMDNKYLQYLGLFKY